MFRRLGLCAATAVRQSGAVRPAAPAALVDGPVAQGGFKLSSLGASFLADRVAAPAGAPAIGHLPLPMCFIDVTYPSGAQSSFIIRPQPVRFFSTTKPENGGEKAPSFVFTDDGEENAKQEGSVGNVAGAKVETFKAIDNHGGQKHPADDHTGVKAVACVDEDGVRGFVAENLDVSTTTGAEVARAKADASEGLEDHGGKKHPAGDQIGVNAFVHRDENGVKADVDENLGFTVAKGDEPARAKAEAKTPHMNADPVAGAKSEADEDGMASIEEIQVVAIASDPRIKPILKNTNADFLAGAKTDLIGEQDHTKQNGTGSGVGQKCDTGENSEQKGTGGDKDDLLCVVPVPATSRRFRRNSKARMKNMAAHFASHRVFVIKLVNKTSLTVIGTLRNHIMYSVVQIKRYVRFAKICKVLVSFLASLLAGMLCFYYGVNYMVQELEDMYEAAASSEFTKNRAKDILHHAADAITPLRMLQVLVRWPWFGSTKEEPAVIMPKRKKRSFIDSVFGGRDEK